jgi:hypothetical protein
MLDRIQRWARDYEEVLVDHFAPWRPPSRDWGETPYRALKSAERRYAYVAVGPLLAFPLAGQFGVRYPALGLIAGAVISWLLLVTAFYGLAALRAFRRSNRERDEYLKTQPPPPWQ